MAAYGRITRFITPLESAVAERVSDVLYGEFMPACYEPDITDHDYFATLEHYGLTGDMPWRANVESLDLRAAIALLTFVLRADHFCEGSLMGSLEDGYLLRVLRRIAELDGTWRRPGVVAFYHEYERDGYLSNWYESAFRFCGDVFPTSEHWMMWQKSRAFGDWEMAGRILDATSADAAKKLGKQVKPFDPKVWDDICLPLMRVGLRHKFAQNERLLNDLLSTGSAVLVEAAPPDTTWGVGVGRKRALDPAEWQGRNLLGIALAEVRSDLRGLCHHHEGPTWDIENLCQSHVWTMNLLELSRVPSTRPIALAYATNVARHDPDTFHDARQVLREVRYRVCGIHDMMCTNMGGGLPVAGWYELLDELAFQVRAGRV